MADKTITAWLVPLKGHHFDLEELPLYLDGSPVTVIKRDAEYFLQLLPCVAGATYERVGQLALEYVDLINGAACTLMQGYRPIALDGGALFGIDAAGEIAHTVMQVGMAEVRCKAGHATMLINGEPQPDLRTGAMTVLLLEASKHTAKADALTIVGRPEPSWSELYLVFELVQAHVGGRMYTEGWITRSDANLFSRTANSYTALGKTGRHGKDSGAPPPEPMPHHTAITLMRSLVPKWVGDIGSISHTLSA